MAHDVFISYATKDKPVADAVCAILESKKIRCWIAPRDVLPGVSYPKAIIDAINETQAMVVVFSSDANQSPNVPREAERAVQKGITIIPFRVENVLPTDSLEYILAGVHWLDALTLPMEDHIGRLAEALGILLRTASKDLYDPHNVTTPGIIAAPDASKCCVPGNGSRTSFIDEFTKMEFLYISGGEFEMGDFTGSGEPNERPAHKVVVNKFYMARFPVTQQQWEKVMGSNPAKYKNGPDYPVNNVSWNDVDEFIFSLNERTGHRYRLPTEAEWEFAARSGGKAEKWSGTSLEISAVDYAWFYSSSDFGTRPVGKKKPNGLGLYDMSGNVWEWCSDWYDAEYYINSPIDNPQGQESGTHRVYRGGSYLNSINEARTTYRGNGFPYGRSSNLGLRLVHPVE